MCRRRSHAGDCKQRNPAKSEFNVVVCIEPCAGVCLDGNCWLSQSIESFKWISLHRQSPFWIIYNLEKYIVNMWWLTEYITIIANRRMHAVESRIEHYTIRYKLENTKFDCEYLKIFSHPRPRASFHNSYQLPQGQPAKAARRIVWLYPCIFVIIERCEQLKRMSCSHHLSHTSSPRKRI